MHSILSTIYDADSSQIQIAARKTKLISKLKYHIMILENGGTNRGEAGRKNLYNKSDVLEFGKI